MFLDDQIVELLSPELRRSAAEYMADVPAAAVRCPEDPDAVNLFSRLELENYLKNTLLRDADVMSMCHGLELRVPLVDHVLVEKALSIAGHLKLQRARKKPLLTDASPEFPEDVALRPKMGFVFPMGEWLAGPLREWFDGRFRHVADADGSCLHPGILLDALHGFHRGAAGMSVSRTWCLFTLACFCETHGIAMTPSSARSAPLPLEQPA
jgi:asparagine synthase (glutamine-hydrolysing)